MLFFDASPPSCGTGRVPGACQRHNEILMNAPQSLETRRNYLIVLQPIPHRPAALEALDAHQVHVNINIPGRVRKAVDLDPSAYYFATVQKVCRRAIGCLVKLGNNR